MEPSAGLLSAVAQGLGPAAGLPGGTVRDVAAIPSAPFRSAYRRPTPVASEPAAGLPAGAARGVAWPVLAALRPVTQPEPAALTPARFRAGAPSPIRLSPRSGVASSFAAPHGPTMPGG